MANSEIEPQMTKVGIPERKPHRREVPAAPPLPRRETPAPAPLTQPPAKVPELVPAR